MRYKYDGGSACIHKPIGTGVMVYSVMVDIQGALLLLNQVLVPFCLDLMR